MEKSNSHPAPWPLLIALFAAMAALQLALPSALRGIATSEVAYAFEERPGVLELAKGGLELPQDEAGFHRRSSINFLLIEGALFASYVCALRLLRRGATPGQERFVFFAGAALVAIPVLSSVMLSTDVLSYTAFGRAVAFHETSPNINPPPLAADDPYMRALAGKYYPCPYGPLWVLLSAGAARGAGEHVGLAVLLFRGIAVLAVVAGASAVRFALRRRAPNSVGYGLAFLLWNPLVALEAGGGGHNDALMIAFLLAAFALREAKRPGWMMALLACSALVKYSTAVLIPLFLIAELRNCPNRRSLLARCALGLLMPTALAFGLLNRMIVVREESSPIGRTLALAFGQDYTNSWQELAYRRLRILLGDPPELVEPLPGFAPWWVAPTATGEMRDRPSDDGRAKSTAGESEPLLVAATAEGDWLLVRGREGKIGYLKSSDTTAVERPDWVDGDLQFAAWEWSPGSTETAKAASLILRLTTTCLFALFWSFSLLRVYRGADLANAATAVLLAVCILLGGWFWPWYILWPLAAATLAPDRRAALLAALLSFSVLTLYAAIGWGGWFDELRSLIAVVGPVVLFGIWAVMWIYTSRSKFSTGDTN